MILFLDTSAHEHIRFASIDGASVVQKKAALRHDQSYKTADFLAQFLKRQKAFKKGSFAAIKKIYIVSGPGSFVGIRVGLSLAMAISFAQKIPLYALTANKVPKNLAKLPSSKAKKVSANFDPDYGALPNITIKPKRS